MKRQSPSTPRYPPFKKERLKDTYCRSVTVPLLVSRTKGRGFRKTTSPVYRSVRGRSPRCGLMKGRSSELRD